ncbi:hypothetical protein [Peribacillus sp. Hz7]|uniref:hypothetical protein n=1 Tax=Peribacillus sp. Hz7 TaxID=3344873 RepID=UPI0035CB3053
MSGLLKKSIIEISRQKENVKTLTLIEYKKLREKFGFRNTGFKKGEISNCFRGWFAQNIVSENRIELEGYSKFFDVGSREGKNNKNLFIDYVLLNMAFAQISIDKEFIEENVFLKYSKVMGRLEVLYSIYEKRKPNGLPKIIDIKHMKNKWFAISLVLFHSTPDELSEDNIINDLFYFYRLHTKQARDLKDRIKEFVILFYQFLVEQKVIKEKENIVEYLYNLWVGKPLTKIDDLWQHFNNKFESYQGNEFYNVIRLFLNESIEKELFPINRLKVIISDWASLTNCCFQQGVKKIDNIKDEHRDEFIRENIDRIKMNQTFNSIRCVLKYYNDVIHDDGYDAQEIIYKFSDQHLPKLPNNINHVGIMETGLKALISSVGSEIIQSRNKRFEDMNKHEIVHFFHVRLIWIVMITGSRVTEVASLLLNEVKNATQYTEPYIKLITLKGNNDREVSLFRGEQINGEIYELDIIHLDIIKETIAASEKMYDSLQIEKKYLFPNLNLSKYSSKSIYFKLEAIQKKNGIICGSHYDILSRALYESVPFLKDKLLKGKVLFTTHDLRHGNINWLLLHGGLTRHEIQDDIGHTNVISQEEYLKTSGLMFKVAKMMEVNDHYSAKNELVSPDYVHIEDNVKRPELLLIQDVADYLDQFENNSLEIDVNEAEEYIDQNTNCHVEFSCSAAGMSCLACEDFQTGNYSEEKMNNISVILVRHIQTIDAQIDKINKNKKSLLSKTKSGESLLINAITSLIKRFVIIDKAMEVSFLSKEQGFGMKEEDAKKIINHFMRYNRKMDLDAGIIKNIKLLKSTNKLGKDIELAAYRTKNNRKVFI